MRPICTVVVDGLPSESSSSSYPGPVSVSEMSLLHALGPVQTWLGQELEKCGIDAMIYTRYVLSLLLHDSYDYDLHEQVFPYLMCFVTNPDCVCMFAFLFRERFGAPEKLVGCQRLQTPNLLGSVM